MTAHTLENILSESADLVEQDMSNYMTYLNHISQPAIAKSVSMLLVVECFFTSGVLWEDINYLRKNELISKVQEKFQQEEDLMEHIKQHQISRETARDLLPHDPTTGKRASNQQQRRSDIAINADQEQALEKEHTQTEELRLTLLRMTQQYGLQETEALDV